MHRFLWIYLLFGSYLTPLQAQHSSDSVECDPSEGVPVTINGHDLTMIIEGDDTLFLADLDKISYTTIRSFKNRNEWKKYRRYKSYAMKVYPYAVEAVRLYRENEFVTRNMRKKQRKIHYKRLQKELKEEFEEPLKDLSRTQGYILLKMVERELDTPMYNVLKSVRGFWTASYWGTFAQMYGFSLKDGYKKGEDPLLDAVLQDLDISHQLVFEEDRFEELYRDIQK